MHNIWKKRPTNKWVIVTKRGKSVITLEMLVAILVTIHWTKTLFKLVCDNDKSNNFINSLPLGNFSCFFVVCWFFFKNQLFWKILSGIPYECQTDWIQIRPDVLSGLIWVQSVCKGYEQTTLVGRNPWQLSLALQLVLTDREQQFGCHLVCKT